MFSVRRSYFSERDFRTIRVIALVSGLLLHSAVIIGLLYYENNAAEKQHIEDLLFGSSGGGGGEGEQDQVIQFGPQSSPQDGKTGLENTAQVNLIDLYVYSDVPNATPVVKKEEPKPFVKKKKVKQHTIIAENLPTRWVRRGTGPGSDGGAGGGSGGGIGKSVGSSIDWGGKGGRRLLSGRIPDYPIGKTNAEMVVLLQFTVLPDGSVGTVTPMKKTDEFLEQSAVSALRTWRFDQLPAEMEQRSQKGIVPFNFTLGRATVRD